MFIIFIYLLGNHEHVRQMGKLSRSERLRLTDHLILTITAAILFKFEWSVRMSGQIWMVAPSVKLN